VENFGWEEVDWEDLGVENLGWEDLGWEDKGAVRSRTSSLTSCGDGDPCPGSSSESLMMSEGENMKTHHFTVSVFKNDCTDSTVVLY